MNKTHCGWVKEQFPYVGTNDYRLGRYTDQARIANAIAQPEQFVEISETLAAAKALPMAIVSLSPASVALSARWLVRRLKPLNVNGQQVETVVFRHWGFEGCRA